MTSHEKPLGDQYSYICSCQVDPDGEVDCLKRVALLDHHGIVTLLDFDEDFLISWPRSYISRPTSWPIRTRQSWRCRTKEAGPGRPAAVPEMRQGMNKQRRRIPGYVTANPLIEFVNLADKRGPDRRRPGPYPERISSSYIKALRSSELGPVSGLIHTYSRKPSMGGTAAS